MAIDLHCHTKISDGSVGIEELVILAKNKGLKTIAITDHDTFAGATRAVIAGKRHGVEVIHGTEISAFDNERNRLVHILCYMCEHPDRLQGMFLKTTENRKRAINIALQKVMRMYPITPEMVAARSQGSVTVFKQHIMQTLIDAGYTDRIYGDLYNKLFNVRFGLAKTSISYPDVFEVLELIQQSGGISVLAHPTVYDSMPLIPSLVEHGLNGIECWYPRATQEDTDELLSIVKEHGLIATGGTDFHGGCANSIHPLGTCLTPDEELEKMKRLKTAMLKEVKVEA